MSASRSSGRPLGLLALLCIVLTCSRMTEARFLEPGSSADRATSSRRLLAAADVEVVSQCSWASSANTCTLGVDYAARTLAGANTDPVATLVAQSLGCARVTTAAACDADDACAWDPAFQDGQQGCFLSDAQQLSIQSQCVQPRYARALSALQACAAQRRGCQCTDAVSCAAVSAAGACRPLLGCWLSKLQDSSVDVIALAEAQLLRVGPLLATLTPNATATWLATAAAGGRRRLLQPTGLNDPVLDPNSDPTAKKATKKPAIAASPAPAKGAAGALAEEGGQNKPILSDAAALSGGPPSSSSGSSAGTGAAKLESGTLLDAGIIQAGVIQPEVTVATPLAPTTTTPTNSDSDATFTYAPPSFWKCVAGAAVAADGATAWAGIDYNSKKLTLDTWLNVIRKLSLLNWGVRTLECFKVQAASSEPGGVGAAPDSQTPKSYEEAITQLIRAFNGMLTQFAEFSRLAPADKPAAATAGLKALNGQLLPPLISSLAAKYNSSAAFSGDSLLQARALLADAQWFVSEAAAIAEATGQPVVAYEAVVGYSAEHMRHLLRWLFAQQFGGPRAYLPTAPPTTPAGLAASQALGTLAAAQLPAAGVPLAEPRWLQARALGTHALLATALEAAALPTGAAGNATLSAGSAVAVIGLAHVADFWGARVEAARASADARMRALALDDRSASRGWRDAALGLSAALSGLRLQVAALGGDESAAPVGAPSPTARVRDGFARLLAGVAADANPALPATAAADAVAAAGRAAALADATLACYGAAATNANASNAARAAACDQLSAAAAALVKAALGDLGASDVLYAAASDDIALQWRCAARAPSACGAVPGCARALLSAAPTPGGYPLVTPLPLPGEVSVCQADDSRLALRTTDDAAKAALASSPACADFLRLPDCRTVTGGPAGCTKVAGCRWQARGSRYALQAPAGGADGVCAADWPAVLATAGPKVRAALSDATAACGAQTDAMPCASLTAKFAVGAAGDGGAGGPPVKIIAPAAAAGGAAALVAAGLAVYAARRRAAAASDDSAASGAVGGGSGRGRRSGKGGKKGGKGVWQRKAKRAEPGEYKPDLMRDSFTDYLSRPAFRAGVAIASANIAAGAQDYENPLHAVGADGASGSGVAGARTLIDLGPGDAGADLATARGSVSASAAAPGETSGLQPRFSYNPFRPSQAGPSPLPSDGGAGPSPLQTQALGGSPQRASPTRPASRRVMARPVLVPQTVVHTDDGAAYSPTSAHDSVYTFRQAPAAAAAPRAGGLAAPVEGEEGPAVAAAGSGQLGRTSWASGEPLVTVPSSSPIR